MTPTHVRGLLDEHGLECWGAVTLMMGARDLLHEDPYVRLGSVAVRQGLPDASSRELGGKIVTVVPSTVGKIVPMGSPADEWRWCVEALKECQAHAETVGVRIGLEPLNRFETYFLNRCEQALALADAVGGDCGVALDAFHMNIEESDLLGAIRAAGDRLVDFHVADNNRMPPGHGALDWDAIVARAGRHRLRGPHDGRVRRLGGPQRDLRARRRSATPPRPAAAPRWRSSCATTRTGAVPEAYYDRYAAGLDRPPARGARRPARRRLMPAVALIGTLDTKGDEIAYVRDRLAALRRAAPS